MLDRFLGEFILNLKTLRKQRNLTQRDLSEKSGISYRTYQRIESGQTEPTLLDIKRITNCLNVKISDLLNFDRNLDENFKIIQSKNELESYSVYEEIKILFDSLNSLYKNGDNIFKLIKDVDMFNKAKSILYISDLEFTYVNRAAISIFPPSFINKKNPTGQTWTEQEKMRSNLCKIYYLENEGDFFSLSPTHKINNDFYKFEQLQTVFRTLEENFLIIGGVEKYGKRP